MLYRVWDLVYMLNLWFLYGNVSVDLLTDFSTIHPKLHFTAETEQNNTVNYLDISIHKPAHIIKIAIYRKPTFIDPIIPYSSNHPTQHKYATIRYL
jgi:hypothetical protein